MLAIMNENDNKKNSFRQVATAGFFVATAAAVIAFAPTTAHSAHTEKASWGIINHADDPASTTKMV